MILLRLGLPRESILITCPVFFYYFGSTIARWMHLVILTPAVTILVLIAFPSIFTLGGKNTHFFGSTSSFLFFLEHSFAFYLYLLVFLSCVFSLLSMCLLEQNSILRNLVFEFHFPDSVIFFCRFSLYTWTTFRDYCIIIFFLFFLSVLILIFDFVCSL